jgi:hypothetical protein
LGRFLVMAQVNRVAIERTRGRARGWLQPILRSTPRMR